METPSRVTAELIKDLAVAATEIKEEHGFQPFVLVPPGFQTQTLSPLHLQPLPDHIRQTVRLSDVASFIQYVKKFATHTAQIFAVANDAGAKLLAVLNYHEGGKEAAAGRGTHQAEFAPSYSPEFSAWLSINGKPLTQEQFLDHLRKWGDTIKSQSDADLIELASSLDFETKGEFSSHVERTKGGRKLLFNEQVYGTAEVKGKQVSVPEGFALELPVFVNGAQYALCADLLYRPQNGSLRIIVELRRQHLVIRKAVEDIVAEVKEGTGIEPFLGALA